MSAIITEAPFKVRMRMIFAAFIGLLLGASEVATPFALLILACALGLKVAVDLRWERTPFFGFRSPYIAYCHNLERAGESVEQAWLSYAMQLFFFGGLIGAGVFALVRALG